MCKPRYVVETHPLFLGSVSQLTTDAVHYRKENTLRRTIYENGQSPRRHVTRPRGFDSHASLCIVALQTEAADGRNPSGAPVDGLQFLAAAAASRGARERADWSAHVGGPSISVCIAHSDVAKMDPGVNKRALGTEFRQHLYTVVVA